MADALDTLLSIVKRHASAEAFAWLQAGLPAEGSALNRPAFLARYAGLPRKLGKEATASPWSEAEQGELRAVGVIAPAVWSLADVARGAALLRAFGALDDAARVALATEIFRRGDTSERVSVLRALALLPKPALFEALGAEANRSHVLDVLAALSCENPFPARALSELAWNQMVVKMLFVGLPLERAHAWQSRVNGELVRITQDFAAERRAAGRPVPDDVARIAAEAALRALEVSS